MTGRAPYSGADRLAVPGTHVHIEPRYVVGPAQHQSPASRGGELQPGSLDLPRPAQAGVAAGVEPPRCRRSAGEPHGLNRPHVTTSYSSPVAR